MQKNAALSPRGVFCPVSAWTDELAVEPIAMFLCYCMRSINGPDICCHHVLHAYFVVGESFLVSLNL